MRVVRQKIVVLCASMLALTCTTNTRDPQDLIDSCYCGIVQQDGSSRCGIWDRNASLSQRTPLLNSSRSSCSQDKCRDLAEDVCGTVAQFTYTPPKHLKMNVKNPCFCDELIVTLDDETFRVCAAWQAHDEHLIEYFTTKSCTPKTCGQSPFKLAQEICTLGFTAFYSPERPVK